MKQQGTIRLSLAVFAFGLSLSLSAFALPSPNPCVVCETTYEKCLNDDVLTDRQCTINYRVCMRNVGGLPCPL
ncbi:hypothetical protein J5226_19795 [Lysobacter sp. K5869]|uniref:hypothetical protein n=1 Tax=Lysobacter sp. K5869 TaxID=2820808 RepID=UPI001C062378|nr:hypothetical protein [Lysobacter sp. K5869]QWP75829.1 hypothetical protein J5226_19795 [Lysobacter sp. K5869]